MSMRASQRRRRSSCYSQSNQDRAVRVGSQNTMPAVGPPRGASSPSLALDLNFDHIHAGGFSRR